MQQGLDALRSQNVVEILRELGNIGAVEDAVLTEVVFVLGDVLLVADVLQVVDLGLHPLVAPFVGIAAVGVFRIVFKYVNAADVHLFSDHTQDMIHGFIQIIGFIEPLEGVLSQTVFGQTGLFIRINALVDGRGVFALSQEGGGVCVIEQEGVFASGFGLVKGLIRVAEQFCIGRSVFGGDGNANGAAEAAIRGQRLQLAAKTVNQTLAAVPDQFHGGISLHQNQKFVAADTGNDIIRPEQPAKLGCGLAQNGVAEQMAMSVVDQLEVVQINDHQGRVDGGRGRGQIFLRILTHCVLIQQLGQRIPFRLILQELRVSLFLVDVGDQTHGLAGIALVIKTGGDPQTAPEVAAIRFHKAGFRCLILFAALKFLHHIAQKRDVLGVEVGVGFQPGHEALLQGGIAEDTLPIAEILHGVGGNVPFEDHAFRLRENDLMTSQSFQQGLPGGHSAGNIQNGAVKQLDPVGACEQLALNDHPDGVPILMAETAFQIQTGAEGELIGNGVKQPLSILRADHLNHSVPELGFDFFGGIAQQGGQIAAEALQRQMPVIVAAGKAGDAVKDVFAGEFVPPFRNSGLDTFSVQMGLLPQNQQFMGGGIAEVEPQGGDTVGFRFRTVFASDADAAGLPAETVGQEFWDLPAQDILKNFPVFRIHDLVQKDPLGFFEVSAGMKGG